MHDGSRSSSLDSPVGVANRDIHTILRHASSSSIRPEAAVAVSPSKSARKAHYQYYQYENATAAKDQSIAGNLKSKMLRAKPLPKNKHTSSLSSGRRHASDMHERRNSEPEDQPIAMRHGNLADHGEPMHGSALQSIN